MPIIQPGGGGGDGGGGIPQGGPLTEDLNFNGFAAENVGTMTAAYIVGVSGGNTSLDGGLISTDGAGNLTAASLNGTGSNIYTGFATLAVVLGSVDQNPGNAGGFVVLDGGGKMNYPIPELNSDSGLFVSDGFGNASAVSFTGDASNLTVSGNALSGLFDGTGLLIVNDLASNTMGASTSFSLNGTTVSQIAGLTGYLATTDASSSGIAAFQGDGSLAQATDTGWTANADSGDKTVIIGSTASLTTIATALNLVSSGAGTALLNIAQKVKALEAALASGLTPNA